MSARKCALALSTSVLVAAAATANKLEARKLTSAHASCTLEPPAPVFAIDGELQREFPPAESYQLESGATVFVRPLHAELQLSYIHELVIAEEMAELVRLADARAGECAPHASACVTFLSHPAVDTTSRYNMNYAQLGFTNAKTVAAMRE